jgi:phosphate uptake regulator
MIAMAQHVESMAFASIEAVLGMDPVPAHDVLDNATRAKAAESQVNDEIVSALARSGISVREIRQAISMLKTSRDLQRLARLTTMTADAVLRLSHQGGLALPELQPLAIAVSHVVRKTLRALIHHDTLLAANVAASSSLVDGYRYYALHTLREDLLRRPDAANILMGSHYLEQIGDSAGNIAENLVLWMEKSQSRAA